MTFNMAESYRKVEALIESSYCLEIQWWNHRHDTQVPEFRLYVVTGKAKGDYRATTFDEILAQLRACLNLPAESDNITVVL